MPIVQYLTSSTCKLQITIQRVHVQVNVVNYYFRFPAFVLVLKQRSNIFNILFSFRK